MKQLQFSSPHKKYFMPQTTYKLPIIIIDMYDLKAEIYIKHKCTWKDSTSSSNLIFQPAPTHIYI